VFLHLGLAFHESPALTRTAEIVGFQRSDEMARKFRHAAILRSIHFLQPHDANLLAEAVRKGILTGIAIARQYPLLT